MTNYELCERIARRWCELMKLNPDDVIRHGSDTGCDVLLYSPLWQRVAIQVPEQIAWVRAILEHSAEMAAEES